MVGSRNPENTETLKYSMGVPCEISHRTPSVRIWVSGLSGSLSPTIPILLAQAYVQPAIPDDPLLDHRPLIDGLAGVARLLQHPRARGIPAEHAVVRGAGPAELRGEPDGEPVAAGE